MEGWIKQHLGEIVVGEHVISNYSDKQLTEYRANSIGFIFQFYNILPTLTVLENVELVNEIVRKPRYAKDVINKVGLQNHYDKFPNQLSRTENNKEYQLQELLQKIRSFFFAMNQQEH